MLPMEVRKALDEATGKIESVLWKLSEGALDHEAMSELNGVLNPPVDAAKQAGFQVRLARTDNVVGRRVDFQMVIATHIRRRRLEAELTQAELAQKMRDRGFDWKRITVAEIEAGADKPGGRKVSYEELYALAELFEAPMALLLLPPDGDAVAIGRPKNLVDPESVRIGVIGQSTLGGK
jgi:transcriptional regulator with XRE-family HTH domain